MNGRHGPAPITFAEIIDRHQAEIWRYLIGLTGNRADAEDLFQDVFMRAFVAFARLRPGSNHRAWLYKIATNVSSNHGRKVRRRREEPLDEAWAFGERPDDSVDRVERTRRVRGAVMELPPKQRAAIIQRKLLGFDYSDIAGNLGCSETAARANVYQALRRLRQTLGRRHHHTYAQRLQEI